MTQLLWLRTTPLPHETPISNASRNAVLNHQTLGAGAFCTDLGLDFWGLQDGKEAAVAQLARMVGVSPLAYYPGTLRREGNQFFLRGERLLPTSVRRSRLVVCPACISNDIATSALPRAASAYCRSHWLLDSIRSCPEHEIELVELPPGSRKILYDFSVQIAPHLDAIDDLPRKVAPRSELRFQAYLHNRLDKKPSATEFLDRLDFHIAARLCEVLGASLSMSASQKLASLSNGDWLSLGEQGFSYASQGPDGIRSALCELQRKFVFSRGRSDGAQAIFGRLFEWVSSNREDEAYTPITDLLREHITTAMPVRAGEAVLGKVVAERQKVHSVRTASMATGISPWHIRKILLALGHLRPEDAKQANSWTLFDAEQHAGLLDDIKASMPLSVASRYLGAGLVHGRLLVEWGLIQPFVHQSAEHAIKEHRFTKRELDRFLFRLMQDASTAEPADQERLFSIRLAAKRALCSSMEIVRLILDRQLRTVRLSPGTSGLLSLLVDVDEVRSKVRGEYRDEVTTYAASVLMRTRMDAVRALISEGVLAFRIVKSPKSRRPARVIPLAAIKEFQKTYCTLAEASRAMPIGHRRLQSILAKRGVRPELPGEKFKVSFYRRSELTQTELK